MHSTIILSALFSLALAAPAPLYARADNLQTFTGALGGITATPITNSGDAKRPFDVKGDTFVNIGAAIQRSCDQQFNACANSANGGNTALSVSACSDQQTQCNAASAADTAAASTANTASTAASNGTAAAAAVSTTAAAACAA